jgi:biopolymer transport protein ExbB
MGIIHGLSTSPVKSMRRLVKPLLLCALCLPVLAHAWWNPEWTQRAKIVVNTTPAGVETKQAVTDFPLAVRLHSGNFDFTAAKEDGSDLRLVAGDDKTPLKFHIERFDSINELAVVWVQVPTVAPGSDKNVVYAYYGNAAAVAEQNAAATYDGSNLAIFHFGEKDVPALDATSGALKTGAAVAVDVAGLLGNAAALSGAPIIINGGDRLKLAAGAAMTISLWVKPTDVAKGLLYSQGGVQLQLAGGKLVAQVAGIKAEGGEIKVGQWQLVALTVGAGKSTLFVDGAQVAQVDTVLPALAGDVQLGEGYSGLLDEVQIANAVRSAEFLQLAAAAPASEGKLLVVTKEAAGEEASEGGGHNYFGVLFQNLTTDAWVIIVILGIMFAISVWVMVSKTLLLGKVKKANAEFLNRYRNVSDDALLNIPKDEVMNNSPLFVLYQAGVHEIEKRFSARASVGAAGSTILSGASIDAIKATIDADYIRENHKLNSLMVLLTIAISGGPFLGLLGTVVGVMITFAAIAAAGDVNVNAIAPGIAAALMATVAGLGVAIPALFGYNWLAAQIKNVTTGLQIFVDEFVTRVAEKYGD